ncbi:MAG: hypothetical protein AB7T10_08760, partial [bacterium]
MNDTKKVDIRGNTFTSHDADEMYDDILRGIEYGEINKHLERLTTVLFYVNQIGLLLILMASSYMIHQHYGFGVAAMFFIVPILLNKNKFKTWKFVWKTLSFISYGLTVLYSLFLSFNQEVRSYLVFMTIISASVIITLLYLILISL